MPLPRRVGPTARPLFWRSRRSHPRTPLPGSACPVHAAHAPAHAAPLPACPTAPTAGTAGGRSGTEDTFPAVRATARPCPAPTERRSTPLACHATDAHGCPRAAPAAAPVPPPSTVLRPTPSVLSSPLAEPHRASPDCTKIQHKMFMRLVLVHLLTMGVLWRCRYKMQPAIGSSRGVLMKIRVVLVSLGVMICCACALSAQKSGKKGGPRKVELPHPFYWAAPDALRGDWQGQGGYVAQVVPVMDRI